MWIGFGCSIRGNHSAEQFAVDSCAFSLGKVCNTLRTEILEISDVKELLQTVKDSAIVRKDSIMLGWIAGLDGLVAERNQLIERAESLLIWSNEYSEILSKWQKALHSEATHDSSLVKMDDAYTIQELAAQKRNCDHLLSEIQRWQKDKATFNTIYDTLRMRTHVILSPKFVVQ